MSRCRQITTSPSTGPKLTMVGYELARIAPIAVAGDYPAASSGSEAIIAAGAVLGNRVQEECRSCGSVVILLTLFDSGAPTAYNGSPLPLPFSAVEATSLYGLFAGRWNRDYCQSGQRRS
jgi:hypothetical protein